MGHADLEHLMTPDTPALPDEAPLAEGWGVEVGLTIDVLVAGLTVIEVPCDITHRVTGNDTAGRLHRASQYKDVRRAVVGRRLRRVHVPSSAFEAAQRDQAPFLAYRAWSGAAAAVASE